MSVDNALLQAGTEPAMQGRINAIANLTKGLQSLSLAPAGYTIHLLANGHRFGSGYRRCRWALAWPCSAGSPGCCSGCADFDASQHLAAHRSTEPHTADPHGHSCLS